MFYVYAHTKPNGEIFYIGKGCGRRFNDTKNRNQHWNHIVQKYGMFNAEILANWDTEQEAFNHEKLLISCFLDMGYNLANKSLGGEGCSGYKYTEEQRKNRSGSGNGMFNRKRTKDEIKKISEQTRVKMAEQGFTHKIKIGEKEFNSKRELARFLNVSHKTIQTWIKLNRLEERYYFSIS